MFCREKQLHHRCRSEPPLLRHALAASPALRLTPSFIRLASASQHMPAVLGFARRVWWQASARHHMRRAKPTGTTSPDAITIGRLHLLLIVGLAASASGFGSLPAHTPKPTPPRVPCSTPVTVTVTVKDTWCKTSHPHDFMGNIGGDGPINGPFTPPDVKAGAHTSPTVVYTHGASAPPAYGGHATQGGAKVLKVCLVSGATACCPGAAACCPDLLGWTSHASGCLTIRPSTPRRGQHRNHWQPDRVYHRHDVAVPLPLDG